MTRYKASVASSRPVEEVFDYLSDFSNTAEWDPGVLSAERVGDGATGVGSEYRLLAEFLGLKTPLTYTTVLYERPTAVTFRAESRTIVSLDHLTFEAFGGGTRLTYDAQLTLRGPLALADSLLALPFRRVGDRALEGLRLTIGGQRDAIGADASHALA